MIIYITTNLINSMKYLGKDRNNIASYYGGGTELKKALKEFGKHNFKKEIIEHCIDIQHLSEREIYWLQYYDAANNDLFYNKTNKSYGSINGPSKTEKYLNRGEKISKSRTGTHSLLASKAQQGINKPNVSKKLTGKKKTKEHCKNISIAKTGIPSKRKGKPDLKQKGKPKPGAGGKGKPKLGAGPKTGNQVLKLSTNTIYNSVKECRLSNNIGITRMFKLLKDEKSDYRYLNKNYYKNKLGNTKKIN
jgi:hypothetical protein